MNSLAGKVAVITGGSRGIGRGIAEAFLNEGANVVINGRSPEKGSATLAELNVGERAHFVAGDVKVREDVERIIDEALSRYGRVDILVNNAGGSGGFAPIHEMSEDAWQE
ncbi:MAG: SDR family NAD(P)-dependent oxidoreductase, partial [Pseudomonadales bacterium]